MTTLSVKTDEAYQTQLALITLTSFIRSHAIQSRPRIPTHPKFDPWSRKV